MIPYGRQYIDKDDLLIVSKSLKQPLITTGSFVKNFEKKLSKFLKVKNAITCNSGTAALHLAFLASDIKKDDVVIMPAINFISAYSMCRQLGAKIFLSDVDSKTGQMTPQLLVECIEENKIKKIKAILTMYMGGFPENLPQLYEIKKIFKCLLIEDGCHAFGADYIVKKKLIKVGACKHSDISTFSLHPLKPITTGEGGIVTTNNEIIAEKIRNFRSHGIIRDPKSHWKYDILNYGYNYRLSDINSALGISQLKKINIFLKKRKKIYENYKSQLDKYKNIISFPEYNKKNKPTYHLVLININFKKSKTDKDMFLKYLNKKNIISQFHYIPIYKFKIFKPKNIKLKNSEEYYKSTLSIPIHHALERKKQSIVIKVIKNFFKDSKKL